MKWLTPSRVRLAAHIGALAPLTLLVWDYFQNQLTVNPIQEMTLRTGRYALILLILSLAVTPLNSLLGLRQLLPARKLLGLYSFMYAGLHFLIFIWLDYGLDLELLQEAIFEKRYAFIGFAAFLILSALAVTSTRGWMRRLGKNWKRLHRLVYLAVGLAIVHFVWLVKADLSRPLTYGAVAAVLLAVRLPWVRRKISRVRGYLQVRLGRSAQMKRRTV
ncbi:MAG: sulfoxide reductase heme-binding subunit YedZ [Chloroflexi bacterium]|nr:MAG: sulfoxide reductase heme-binding subunit YedZ [Chloroflexota bacterium]